MDKSLGRSLGSFGRVIVWDGGEFYLKNEGMNG
jgi:hypothetical protein